jgi:hypothetical protein
LRQGAERCERQARGLGTDGGTQPRGAV